ncbi:hypothetical protein [uncultured Methylobacterium sp.]|uniref:hypothetical protein n=1 Tax=uncultured Methylobacterium sp. TaxID=157278 RepID=UPI0035CC7EC6
MLLRFVCAALVGAPLLAGTAMAQAAREPAAKEMTVGQSAARQRQKACGTQWRALSVSEKATQGPKWPQYFSKCVKRLKEQKA